MGTFVDVTLARVPAGMVVPTPIRLLLEWVEERGLVETGHDGDLVGMLTPDWPRGPGTQVLLRGSPPEECGDHIAAWFGPTRDGLPILWPFCRTGGDGSYAALWTAPDGGTRVVHLASGSGSMLTCVLGEDAVDFLRLLAIGYPEVCWNQEWAEPPIGEDGRSTVNAPYRSWVETTFATTIPLTATEIVPHPAEMGDTDTDDEWCRWVNAAQDLDEPRP